MKKKLLSFLISLALFAAVLPCSFADELPPMVVDGADLFSDAEEQALISQVSDVREVCKTDVIIVTTSSLSGQSPQKYADDFFDYNGYGYGSNRSGVLFLISMEERDWYISTSGDAIYALTDYGIQQLGNVALENGLSSGEYYRAFAAYLDALPEFFEALDKGSPVDGYADYSGSYYHGEQGDVIYYEEESSPNIVFSVIIGLVIASAALLIMRAGMNTRRKQRSASSYLKNGSLDIHTLQDMFLYSSVSKTRRAESNSNRGGGSSIHTSSHGSSHGGGGGKF